MIRHVDSCRTWNADNGSSEEQCPFFKLLSLSGKLKKAHLYAKIKLCKAFGSLYLTELMRKAWLKILLTSLTINDKDCRNERSANNVKKTGGLYSGKALVSSSLFSVKYYLISAGFIYLDTVYTDLKMSENFNRV